MLWAISGAVGLLFLVVLLIVWDTSTCAKRGPERLSHMQQIGTMIVPIYASDCLKRVVK